MTTKPKKKPCPDLSCGICPECVRLRIPNAERDSLHRFNTDGLCGDCDRAPCRCAQPRRGHTNREIR